MTRLNNPLSSLCLTIICRWISVVRRGKGGQIDKNGIPWTRLPAWEITDQLDREFYLAVSIRRVQRALKELEDAKLIRRARLTDTKYRQCREYWYTLPTEEENPATMGLARHQSPRLGRSATVKEGRPISPSDLSWGM